MQHGRHVGHDVTVKQPIARALRRPRHRHRRSRLHELRHHTRLPVVGERPIPRAVAQAVNREVEAMQVHGVNLGAEVDDAPAGDLAELIAQSLGVRPASAVDQGEHLRANRQESRAGIQLRRPASAAESRVRLVHSVMTRTRSSRRGSRRIDNEGARQLRIVNSPELLRHAGAGGPIAVGAGHPALEAQCPRLAGTDLQGRTGVAAVLTEAGHAQGVRQVIADADRDFRSFRNPNERRGRGER